MFREATHLTGVATDDDVKKRNSALRRYLAGNSALWSVTSKSETTHLTCISRVTPDDDITKRNSAPSKISILVEKLCPTIMLVREDGGESLADFASWEFMSCEGFEGSSCQLAVWSSGMILLRVREVLGSIPRTAQIVFLASCFALVVQMGERCRHRCDPYLFELQYFVLDECCLNSALSVVFFFFFWKVL